MCPGPQAEGHDAPGLADERVPGVAAVIHIVGVGGEDAVREPVVAHELPDVLDGVELRRSRRQGQERDVVGYDEVMRAMPTCLVEQQHRVGAGATAAEISARWSVIPSVLQRGRMSAAPLPSAGQMAP